MKIITANIPKPFWIAAAAAIMVISGCTAFFSVQMLQSQLEPRVDEKFADAYEDLGGEDVFGPPISGLMVKGKVQYQHFHSASIMFDPDRLEGQQIILAPIGITLNYHDPLPPTPADDTPTIDGYLSIPEFYAVYKGFGGEAAFGKALTNVRFNREFNRLEQYFTYFGLYLSAGASDAQFLSYGSFACSGKCSPLESNDSEVMPLGSIPEPFLSAYRVVGSSLTGRMLNGPIRLGDGSLEMIFENLVMGVGAENGDQVYIKQITEYVGYTAEPLIQNLNDPRIYFVDIQNGSGHNVVLPFIDLITRHGGFPVSGQPTTEGSKIKDGIYRQCFSKICLEYFVNAPANLNVMPLDVGREYFALKYGGKVQPTTTPPSTDFDFVAYAAYPVIKANQQQSFFASFHHGTAPQVAVEMTLTLNLPNGKQRVYALPPTDQNGETEILIQAIPDLTEGLAGMEICLNNAAYQIPCIEQSYQIISSD